LFTLHKAAAIGLALVMAAHIGAALMHLIVKKDGVFRRMLPGG
jgi:cytochrome b561